MTTLNPKQQAVVDAPVAGAMVIDAGAGTGKTTTILQRANRVFEQDPGDMLIVTYTKAVTAEIAEKAKKVMNPFACGMTKVKTTFALAWSMVRKNYAELGFQRLPDIPKDFEIYKVCKEVCKSYRVFLDETQIKALLAAEAWRVGTEQLNYDGFARRSKIIKKLTKDFNQQTLLQVMETTRDQLREKGWFTKGDMLLYALRLPDECYADMTFRHIFVDEVQDLTKQQHRFMARFRQFATSFTMVGDVAQAIYEWNGASPHIFREAAANIGATRYVLDTNYRSKQPILDLANKLLANELVDTPLRLQANGEQEGNPVVYYQNADDIVFWLKSLIDGGVDPNDIAILHRARKDTLILETMLAANGIVYTCSGDSFFEHPVIKDLTAYYELLIGIDRDDRRQAWLAVAGQRQYLSEKMFKEAWEENPAQPWMYWPATHFKNEGQKQTWNLMRQELESARASILNQAPQSFLNDVHEKLLKRKWDAATADNPNTADDYSDMFTFLKSMLQDFRNGQEFYDYLRNRPETSSDGVNIMTGHKSKGLEFPYVAIWGATDGVFPRSLDEPEEIRLLYVAVTRAMKELAVFADKRQGLRGRSILASLIPDPTGGLKGLFGL